jgi:predicted DNA-binding transcriptional regulator AlpA
MAKPKITAPQPNLIDAVEVGKLCGGKAFSWAHFKVKTTSDFPRPAVISPGKGGEKVWWRRSEILAWWEAEQRGENDKSKPEKEPAFAGDMAMQFIRGGFGPPHKQIDRRRRIERARLKGVKNQPRIHLQGDWDELYRP